MRDAVSLDVPKAARLVREAAALQRAGFGVPVDADANANDYDRAFAALVAASGGAALAVRTNDDELPPRWPACAAALRNGAAEMFYGDAARACPWRESVGAVRAQFGL